MGLALGAGAGGWLIGTGLMISGDCSCERLEIHTHARHSHTTANSCMLKQNSKTLNIVHWQKKKKKNSAVYENERSCVHHGLIEPYNTTANCMLNLYTALTGNLIKFPYRVLKVLLVTAGQLTITARQTSSVLLL